MSPKYSICVVNYKDYASLNRCVELIRKRESEDYEIIVWDNTPISQKLESFHLERIKTFRNGEENGFARGVNLAVQAAKGEYLVFINPDTEPTGDWLDRMARGLDRYDYIGSTSDYIAGIQSYRWYLDNPREFVDTKLIIPVCAIIKASTFREMGGFDERFFLGCEDLDFSWRMNLAGKKMGIATNVFIHHVGHTGFELTPGKDQIIKDMESKIRAKLKDYYGTSVPSSEELWGCKILATELRPQTLSICMIVRDNIKAATEAINTYSRIADNLVIVATSPDFHTEHIESGHIGYNGHKCIFQFYRYKWEDDFATARNHALSKCNGDWVLWLDDDDRLDDGQAALIDALMKKPGNMTALKACHFAFEIHNTDKDGNTMDVFAQSRLFPRLPGIKWGGLDGCHGYVHETIWESAEAAGLQLVKTNIVLKHTGYSDPEVMAKKQERNIRLLLKEPENAFSLYNLGQAFLNVLDLDKALDYYQKAIPLADNRQFQDHIRYCAASVCLRLKDLDGAKGFLADNSKPDAMFTAGEMKIISGEAVEEGCDLLWAYLKMGKISDVFGSNYVAFRKAAIDMLNRIGVIIP